MTDLGLCICIAIKDTDVFPSQKKPADRKQDFRRPIEYYLNHYREHIKTTKVKRDRQSRHQLT